MFQNPTLLLALGAMSIPLLLHLLSRLQARNVEWGAMMFVSGLGSKRRDSGRLRQWTLLAIRSLMLGLLALALARPLWQGQPVGQASRNRIDAVIIFDRSGSMEVIEAGRSRLDHASEAAVQILSSLQRDDRAAVIFTPPLETGEAIQLTPDLAGLAQRIRSVSAADGPADVAGSLQQAARLLENAQGSQQVYVVSDQQALSWQGVDASSLKRVDDAWGCWITIGLPTPENCAILDVRSLNRPAIEGEAVQLQATVQNFGRQPRFGVELNVYAGNRALLREPVVVNVPPGEQVQATLPTPGVRAGARLLTVKMQTEGLRRDDAYGISIDVLSPPKVLIVSGDEREAFLQSESDYLRAALTPRKSAGLRGGDLMRVEVIAPEQLTPQMVQQSAVVVLANVPTLTGEQGRALLEFVWKGGGLFVAPGSEVVAEDYNTTLGAEGLALLPAELQEPTAEDGSAATRIVALDLEHPALQWAAQHRMAVTTPIMGRYFPVQVTGPTTTVIGGYANGDPFLVHARVGRGEVVLMTTPLDADWSSLPLTDVYLPLVQSVVRQLATGSQQRLHLPVGQILRWRGKEQKGDGLLTLPSGRTVRLTPTSVEEPAGDAGATVELRYAPADMPGVYRLRYGRTQTQWTVYAARTESDTRGMSTEERRTILSDLGWRTAQAPAPWLGRQLQEWRQGWELWTPLLVAVICLVSAEVVLLRQWTRRGEGDGLGGDRAGGAG